MSLSSDATLTMPVQPAYGNGNGGMWGGDWGAWIILFLIFGMFGWGGYGGFGGGNGVNGPGFQGYATRADINEGFALNGLQNGQTSIRDAVSNGFHGVDNAFVPWVIRPSRALTVWALRWLSAAAIPSAPLTA